MDHICLLIFCIHVLAFYHYWGGGGTNDQKFADLLILLDFLARNYGTVGLRGSSECRKIRIQLTDCRSCKQQYQTEVTEHVLLLSAGVECSE